MRKMLLSLFMLLCCPFLLMTVSADAGMQPSDVELAEYKQIILPVVDRLIDRKEMTEEEFESFRANVWNGDALDQPIRIGDWATMLKIAMNLPADQSEMLLNMYVYYFAQDDGIVRENAVGGMVKLMTVRYIGGHLDGDDYTKAKQQINDFEEISEMQAALVAMAWREGVLDDLASGAFRPKDHLTHAEAVSMMSRVMAGFTLNLQKVGLDWPQTHWLYHEIDQLRKTDREMRELLTLIDAIARERDDTAEVTASTLNQPISGESWAALLTSALGFHSAIPAQDREERQLLIGSVEGERTIDRGRAVADMIRLLRLNGREIEAASEFEWEAARTAFRDFDQADAPGELAVAYRIGLVGGYGNGTFRPAQALTRAEAIALAARLGRMDR